MRLHTEGSGPLVVKIAGIAAGVGLYHEEIALARRSGFRVAALDTSGDRSDDPATCRLTWDFLAGEVIRALDRLDARRAVIWGTSFGALVCLAVASRFPDRVRGMLLSSPPEPGWRPQLYLRLYRGILDWRRPAVASAGCFSAGFLLFNAWEFVNPVALTRLPALAHAARDAKTPAQTTHEKIGLLLHDHPGLPGPEQGIACSIVSGTWDTITGPGASLRLAGMLPGARLRRVRFAGHSCAYSHPTTYGRWAVEELRRLTERP